MSRSLPYKYKTVLCNNYTYYGNCPKGFNCNYAHGQQELRTSNTSNYTHGQQELRTSNTSNYAHGQQELRTSNTSNYTHGQQELRTLNTSNYAHGQQELRTSNAKNYYDGPKVCQFFNTDKGCSKGPNCEFEHLWFEDKIGDSRNQEIENLKKQIKEKDFSLIYLKKKNQELKEGRDYNLSDLEKMNEDLNQAIQEKNDMLTYIKNLGNLEDKIMFFRKQTQDVINKYSNIKEEKSAIEEVNKSLISQLEQSNNIIQQLESKIIDLEQEKITTGQQINQMRKLRKRRLQ